VNAAVVPLFILQIGGWFIFSCILMSFIEHQVHSKLMHRRNFLSARTASYKRVFEAHAIVHPRYSATNLSLLVKTRRYG
jgi:hypothetical protein